MAASTIVALIVLVWIALGAFYCLAMSMLSR
jgi:hypothetical protein